MQYQEIVENFRDGILRFLDRPENATLKECFTGNPAWAVYQMGIDEELYDEMDALSWIAHSSYVIEPNSSSSTLWEDAMYQVTMALCLTE
jgi:hypothetical protein